MGIKQRFKHAIYNLINWARSDNVVMEQATAIGHSKSQGHLSDRNQGMNFTVYSAIGGKVIQIHTYDPTTDRSRSTLYIVTDKEDMGEELGQIITRESLTR
jgi:hypothetical protein